VSPDVGGVVRARAAAKRINDSDLAIIDKRRPAPNMVKRVNQSLKSCQHQMPQPFLQQVLQ
jgi:phosphoribosylpyrophosphate synthetase